MSEIAKGGIPTDHFNLAGITAEELFPVYSRLKEILYDEEHLFEALHINEINEIKFPYMPVYIHRYLGEPTPLNIAIRLFLLADQADEDHLLDLFSPDCIFALKKAGVLKKAGDIYTSTVDIYPCMGSFICTDHLFSANYGQNSVYYLGLDSYMLARVMQREKVASALDLCTGSGVQAITAARFAEKVTGVDINPRAVNFARFNAMFNQLDNVEFVTGDLYEPTKDEKYDRIYANPPFVPSPRKEILFRDGSATGEDILKKIIEGLRHKLKENGICQITTLLVMTSRDYNEKIGSWLENQDYSIITLATNYDMVVPYIFKHMDFSLPYDQYTHTLLEWADSYQAHDIRMVSDGLINIIKQSGHRGRSIFKDFKPHFRDFSHEAAGLFHSPPTGGQFMHRVFKPGKNLGGIVSLLDKSGDRRFKAEFTKDSIFIEEEISAIEKEILEKAIENPSDFSIFTNLIKEKCSPEENYKKITEESLAHLLSMGILE